MYELQFLKLCQSKGLPPRRDALPKESFGLALGKGFIWNELKPVMSVLIEVQIYIITQ